MTKTFNADEVLEMAVQIEENGAAFYRRAAELHADDPNRDLLLEFASMEDEHRETFARMREDTAAQHDESALFDPNDEAALYLDAMADSHGGEGSVSVTEALTGQESMDDILQTALDLEKKSQGFNHGFVMRFESRAALEAYATHPAHLAASRELLAICDGGAAGVVVYDLQT